MASGQTVHRPLRQYCQPIDARQFEDEATQYTRQQLQQLRHDPLYLEFIQKQAQYRVAYVEPKGWSTWSADFKLGLLVALVTALVYFYEDATQRSRVFPLWHPFLLATIFVLFSVVQQRLERSLFKGCRRIFKRHRTILYVAWAIGITVVTALVIKETYHNLAGGIRPSLEISAAVSSTHASPYLSFRYTIQTISNTKNYISTLSQHLYVWMRHLGVLNEQFFAMLADIYLSPVILAAGILISVILLVAGNYLWMHVVFYSAFVGIFFAAFSLSYLGANVGETISGLSDEQQALALLILVITTVLSILGSPVGTLVMTFDPTPVLSPFSFGGALGISSLTAIITSLLHLNVEVERQSITVYVVRLLIAVLLAYAYAKALRSYVHFLISTSLFVAAMGLGLMSAMFVFEHFVDPTAPWLGQVVPLAPVFQTLDEFRSVWGPGLPPVEHSLPTLAAVFFVLLFFRTTSNGSVKGTTQLVGFSLAAAWLASVVLHESCAEGLSGCEFYSTAFSYIFTSRFDHVGYQRGLVFLVVSTLLIGGWLVAICSQYERLTFAVVTAACGSVGLCLVGIIFANDFVLSIPFELVAAFGVLVQLGQLLFNPSIAQPIT